MVDWAKIPDSLGPAFDFYDWCSGSFEGAGFCKALGL